MIYMVLVLQEERQIMTTDIGTQEFMIFLEKINADFRIMNYEDRVLITKRMIQFFDNTVEDYAEFNNKIEELERDIESLHNMAHYPGER